MRRQRRAGLIAIRDSPARRPGARRDRGTASLAPAPRSPTCCAGRSAARCRARGLRGRVRSAAGALGPRPLLEDRVDARQGVHARSVTARLVAARARGPPRRAAPRPGRRGCRGTVVAGDPAPRRRLAPRQRGSGGGRCPLEAPARPRRQLSNAVDDPSTAPQVAAARPLRRAHAFAGGERPRSRASTSRATAARRGRRPELLDDLGRWAWRHLADHARSRAGRARDPGARLGLLGGHASPRTRRRSGTPRAMSTTPGRGSGCAPSPTASARAPARAVSSAAARARGARRSRARGRRPARPPR